MAFSSDARLSPRMEALPNPPGRPRDPRGTPGSTVLELLQPGAFVKLRNQPEDLPPFQLIRCRGGRCWVRQQAWGKLVHWEVAHRQLTAVASTHRLSPPPVLARTVGP